MKRSFYRVATAFALVSILIVPAFAGHIAVPARAPAIITAPDYADPFLSPSGAGGHTFESKEGYVFSYDSMQRRMYQMPYSYAIEVSPGRTVPVEHLGKTVVTTVLVDGMFVAR